MHEHLSGSVRLKKGFLDFYVKHVEGEKVTCSTWLGRPLPAFVPGQCAGAHLPPPAPIAQ